MTLTPSTRISYEYSNRDLSEGKEYLNLDGNVIFQNIGLKSYDKHIVFGATFWIPLRQELNDQQLQNKHRINSDLTYYFN